jgi:hypothetical protein
MWQQNRGTVLLRSSHDCTTVKSLACALWVVLCGVWRGADAVEDYCQHAGPCPSTFLVCF